MTNPFDVFGGRVKGVIWGKKEGDFRLGAADSMTRHEEAARALGIAGGRLIFPSVEHGSTIGVFGQTPVSAVDHLRWRSQEPCDGFLLSSNGKIGIAFTPADCSIVALFGERRAESFLALLHCGWRGVLANIIGKAVNLFCGLGIPRKDMRVLITPGIGACCFEVNPDVMGEYLRKFPDIRFRSRSREGRPSINLMRVITEEVMGSDIGCFSLMAGCSKCGSPKFWSHRRGDKERNLVAAALSSV
ncbi:polyphenol oxidase family protein [Candidatus Uhrbacteria bacterium]|nr:polyphenol oxidase family protein [Candidatus Uhrbacteria bacterium]